MANLTFSDLQNEVYAQTGLDSTNSTNQANVNRWINYVQQEICARWPWAFMDGREAIVTVKDYITGTVSINAGSTALTGSGTTFAAAVDTTYFIQLSSANDWYQVSVNGGATSLTLATAYAQTTNATNLTYTLRKFFYSLSSSADEVLDVRNWNTPDKLIQCDFRTIDLINPLVQSTNAPYAYMMYGVDTSGNQVFMPYPFPTDARLFEFRTKKRPTDMVAATDSPSIPNKFAHVIAWGAVACGWAFKNNLEAAQAWSTKFEAKLDAMKKEYRQSGDYQPVLGSIDTVSRNRWIQFPAAYPNITTGQ